MANTLQNVQETYTTLQSRYAMLRLACQNQDQIDALGQKYSTAQQNYLACVDQSLEDDNADVAALSATLVTQNQQLANSVAEMGDMSKVLDTITDALTTGAALIARAGL